MLMGNFVCGLSSTLTITASKLVLIFVYHSYIELKFTPNDHECLIQTITWKRYRFSLCGQRKILWVEGQQKKFIAYFLHICWHHHHNKTENSGSNAMCMSEFSIWWLQWSLYYEKLINSWFIFLPQELLLLLLLYHVKNPY